MKSFLLCCTLSVASISILPALPLGAAEPTAITNNNERKLIDRGLAAFELGDYQIAVDYWQQHRQRKIERRSTSQPSELDLEGLVYLSLGYQKLGQQIKAKQTIALSKAALSDANSPEIKAKIHNISGTIALENGDYAAASDDWQQAAKLYKSQGDRTGLVGSEINRAIALQKLGKYRQSLNLLANQNGEIDKLPAPLKFQSLQNLGIAYAKVGDYPQAQTTFKEASKIAQSSEQKASASISLGNLNARSEPNTAIEHYQQAVLDSGSKETIILARLNQLEPLMELKRESEAKESLAQIKQQLETLANSHRRDELYLKLFARYLEINPEQIDESSLLDIEDIAENGKNSRTRSYALGSLADYYARQGLKKEAIDYNQQALFLSQQQQAYDLSYRWQWQLGKLLVTDDYRKAIGNYQAAVENLNRVRGDLISYSQDSQYDYKTSIEPVYRQYVSLLLDNPTQENLKEARNTIESLQMAELENYFRSACLRAEPQQIDNLDPTAATIYPIVLDNKLAVITAFGDRLEYQSFNVGEEEIRSTVSEYVDNFSPAKSRRKREQLGAKLYSWLVEANKAKFEQQQIETLVFILDGPLRNLPVSALNDQGKYLIEDYEIALTPGLQLLPSRQISQEQLEAVVGGLSEARQGFTALPGVEAEVNQVADEIKANLLFNETFTNDKLQNALARTQQAPVLHLATHGQFSSNPEDTYVLTWEDRLNVNELESLLKVREETPKLIPIELLVLSACKTATGDEQAALGLAGVALRSGARSTLATLWSVDDLATTSFVDEVYTQLKQSQSKGETLRQAQLKLINSEEYSHPFYWSPFVLVGNWN